MVLPVMCRRLSLLLFKLDNKVIYKNLHTFVVLLKLADGRTECITTWQ